MSEMYYSRFIADVTVMIKKACSELQQPAWHQSHLSPTLMLIQERKRKRSRPALCAAVNNAAVTHHL